MQQPPPWGTTRVLVGWVLTRLVKVRMLLGPVVLVPAGTGVLGRAGPEGPAPVDLGPGPVGPGPEAMVLGRGGGALLGWRPAGGLRAGGGP